jgi:hypothetical protein
MRRNFQTLSNRAFRPIAAILSVLLLAGAPVQAAPIAFNEVIQVLGRYHNQPELRLASVNQTVATPVSGVIRVTRIDSSTARQYATNDASDIPVSSSVDLTSNSVDSLLGGVAVSTDDLRAGVEVVDQSSVEGTICDCGEISVAGGFPKWPLLFLAAIPFFFIHDCDDCEPTPTPSPSIPQTPEIPEPTSLLLFGTGLAAFGAGMRRRYTAANLAAQIEEKG